MERNLHLEFKFLYSIANRKMLINKMLQYSQVKLLLISLFFTGKRTAWSIGNSHNGTLPEPEFKEFAPHIYRREKSQHSERKA